MITRNLPRDVTVHRRLERAGVPMPAAITRMDPENLDEQANRSAGAPASISRPPQRGTNMCLVPPLPGTPLRPSRDSGYKGGKQHLADGFTTENSLLGPSR